MPQTSFQLDDGTAKAIDELKGVFGVSTSTGVIRRAIALARVANRLSNGNGEVTMLDKDSQPTIVLLNS